MDHSIIYVATALGIVGGITVFYYANREFAKKRRDYRMGQALRRGIAQGVSGQIRTNPRVVQWQSCESTSAR